MKVYWIGKYLGRGSSHEPEYLICWITNFYRMTSRLSEAAAALERLRKEHGHEFKYELFEEEV